jgi:hypothetical protein
VAFYGVEGCPVGDAYLICLKSRASSDLLLFCPGCGCAFREPPGNEMNEIKGLDEIAPAGVVLPSWHEVKRSGWANVQQFGPEWTSWIEEDLEDVLGRPQSGSSAS